MEKYKIKVITSYKLADAFICRELEKYYPDMEIIRYKIPVNECRKWYFKKLRKEGTLKSIGIKLMGIYLGLGNLYNSIRNTTIWQQLNLPLPEWSDIDSKVIDCFNEDELFDHVKNADCIIVLDTLRLPQKFFSQIKAPFLQAVYGIAPFYTGHTGVFWAYANSDYANTGISIVQRGKYFTKSKVLSTAQIQFTGKETLRSLRTKAALKIAEILPRTIETVLTNAHQINYSPIVKPKNYCTTPTLYFYLRFRIFNTLHNCVYTLKQNHKRYICLR